MISKKMLQMRRVIVNFTPLLALENIGRFDILRSLYGRLEIASAVYREISQKDEAAKNCKVFWLESHRNNGGYVKAKNNDLISGLRSVLDKIRDKGFVSMRRSLIWL